MAENGILDYQGMNQAIYRGATSNIVVDTQSMSIEIGAGNSSHTSNLHIECDHDANVASIQLNSNVVTEFSRSKKLIKYPRVALTADAQTELGYEGYFVSQDSATLNGTSNRQAWAFFDIEGSDGTSPASPHLVSSSTDRFDSNGNYTGGDSLANVSGDWIYIRLPDKIQLQSVALWARITNGRNPVDATVLGSLNGTNWSVLGSWTGATFTAGESSSFTINSIQYYDYIGFVFEKIEASSSGKYVNFHEIDLYGVPEYDPEAHGTDVTVKSVANVPNTDWLEVYYDAKNYTNGNSVQDETDNNIDGSFTGITHNTEYNSFDFSGVANSSKITATLPSTFAGNQPFTVSVWFKRYNDLETENTIWRIGPRTDEKCLALAVSNGNFNFFGNDSTDGIFSSTTFNGGGYVVGRWYHVACVYDGSSRYIFIDSVRDGTTVTNSLDFNASTELVLGFNGVNKYLNGSIANFRLFNRALTSDEIYQLYAYQKEDFGHSTNNMTLKAGRLGIGTSEPRAALDVRGDVLIQSMISHVNGFYEEGTWVPIIYGSTSGKKTPTTTNAGWWVRVGNLVTIGGTVGWSGGDNISGMVKIGYLPYKSMNRSNYRAAMNFGVSSSGISTPSGQNVIRLVLDPGQDGIYLTVSNEYRSTNLNYDHYPTIGASGVIYGLGGTYRI